MAANRIRIATFERTGHGAGAGSPHIEVAAKDLPRPVLAVPQAVASGPLQRRQGGQIADSETARTLGRLGGQRKARKVRLVDSLGLSDMVAESSFGPYRAAADEFVRHHLGELAKSAGGEVGPGPSTMVASAGLQLAASRWAFDRAAEKGDPALMKLGSALADASRQNLLAAFSLAVREAEARPPVPVDMTPLMQGDDDDEEDDSVDAEIDAAAETTTEAT